MYGEYEQVNGGVVNRLEKEKAELLEKIKTTITYILSEIDDCPEDSRCDIANDAFLNCELSLQCQDDYEIIDFEWPAL